MRAQTQTRRRLAASLRMSAIAALALPLFACATAPVDVVLGPGSPDALVVVELAPNSVPASAHYQVEAAAFDAAQSRIEGSGYFYLPVSPKAGAPAPRYTVARAKPGTYALTAVSHNTLWYDCFNGGTVAFTVEPGTVTFLGRFDARPSLRDIVTKLPSYSMNQQRHYLLDSGRPALTAPTDTPGWNEGLSTYLRETFPNVGAPVRAAELRPATFASGWSLLGQKVCYGYFNRAKDGKASKTP